MSSSAGWAADCGYGMGTASSSRRTNVSTLLKARVLMTVELDTPGDCLPARTTIKSSTGRMQSDNR